VREDKGISKKAKAKRDTVYQMRMKDLLFTFRIIMWGRRE
jgi:hypothetical protein